MLSQVCQHSNKGRVGNPICCSQRAEQAGHLQACNISGCARSWPCLMLQAVMLQVTEKEEEKATLLTMCNELMNKLEREGISL